MMTIDWVAFTPSAPLSGGLIGFWIATARRGGGMGLYSVIEHRARN